MTSNITYAPDSYLTSSSIATSTLTSNATSNFTAVSPGLTTIQITKSLLGFANLALHSLIIMALRYHTSQHPNVRLVVGNISIAALTWNSSHLGRLVNYFVLRGQDGGLSVISMVCSFSQVLEGLALRAASLSIAFVGVERFIATRWHQTYEHRTATIGVALATFTWIQSLGFTAQSVYSTLANNQSGVQRVEFCGSYVQGSSILGNSGFIANIIFLMFCTVSSMTIYFVVYKLNLRLLRKFNSNALSLSLSSRMQLKHSIETTRSLAACVLAHAVIRGTNQVYATIINVLLATHSTQVKVEASLISDVAIAFWFTVHAGLFIWHSEHSQEKIVEKFLARIPLFKRTVERFRSWQNTKLDKVYSSTSNDEHYFEQLANHWEGIAGQPAQSPQLLQRRGRLFNKRVMPSPKSSRQTMVTIDVPMNDVDNSKQINA